MTGLWTGELFPLQFFGMPWSFNQVDGLVFFLHRNYVLGSAMLLFPSTELMRECDRVKASSSQKAAQNSLGSEVPSFLLQSDTPDCLCLGSQFVTI